MRKTPVLLLVLLFGQVTGADLITTSGQQYKNYSVTGVYEHGITIFHASGAANIPLSELPDDLRQKYSAGVEKKQEESRQVQSAADTALDNQRGTTAEPVSRIREKLKKATAEDRAITVHDKNGKKHENCRIQHIGSRGLTLKINGTTVYIPFQKINNMTDGVLSTPEFVVKQPNARTERKTSPKTEVTGNARQPVISSSPDISHTPGQTVSARPASTGEPVAFSQPQSSHTVEKTASGRTIYTGPRGGKYYYNSKGNKTYVRRRR